MAPLSTGARVRERYGMRRRGTVVEIHVPEWRQVEGAGGGGEIRVDWDRAPEIDEWIGTADVDVLDDVWDGGIKG